MSEDTNRVLEELDQILLSSECLDRETAIGDHVTVELSNIPRELAKIAPPVTNIEQALLQGQLLLAQQGIDADHVDKRIRRLESERGTLRATARAQVEKTPSGADNDKVPSAVEAIHEKWRKDMNQKMENLCKREEMAASDPQEQEYWKQTVIREYMIEQAKDIHRRFKERFILDQEKAYWRQFCDECKQEDIIFDDLDTAIQDFVAMRICLSPFLSDDVRKDATAKEHLKLMLRGVAKCFRFMVLIECGVTNWDTLYDLVLGQPDDATEERVNPKFKEILERGKFWTEWTRIRCFPDEQWGERMYPLEDKELCDAYLRENVDLSFMYEDRFDMLWHFCAIILQRQIQGWHLENQAGSSEAENQKGLKKFHEQVQKAFNAHKKEMEEELLSQTDKVSDAHMPEVFSQTLLFRLALMNFREFANIIDNFLSGSLLKDYILPLEEANVKLILEVVLLIYMHIHPMLANDGCCPFTDLGDLGAAISLDSGLVQSMPEVVIAYVMATWKKREITKESDTNTWKDPKQLLGTVIEGMDGPVTILKHMILAGYDLNLDQFQFTTKILPGMSLQEKVEILETLLEVKRRGADSTGHSDSINELVISVVSVCDQLPQVDKARVLRILEDPRWNTNVKPEVEIWNVAAKILFEFDRNMDKAMRLYDESRCEVPRGGAKVSVHVIPHEEREIKDLMDVLKPSIIDGSTVLSGVAIRCIAALLKQPNETQRIQVLIKFLEQLRRRGARFTTCYLSVDDQERLAWIQRMAADKK